MTCRLVDCAGCSPMVALHFKQTCNIDFKPALVVYGCVSASNSVTECVKAFVIYKLHCIIRLKFRFQKSRNALCLLTVYCRYSCFVKILLRMYKHSKQNVPLGASSSKLFLKFTDNGNQRLKKYDHTSSLLAS